MEDISSKRQSRRSSISRDNLTGLKGREKTSEDLFLNVQEIFGKVSQIMLQQLKMIIFFSFYVGDNWLNTRFLA